MAGVVMAKITYHRMPPEEKAVDDIWYELLPGGSSVKWRWTDSYWEYVDDSIPAPTEHLGTKDMFE